MMEYHEFCDHCPGCRPSFFCVTTGHAYPDDSPVMIAVNRIWNTETTYAERKAFIAVTLHNSLKPTDIDLANDCIAKISRAVP